jgi:hypothetical protein
MTETAELYRKAQDIVLKRYATEPSSKGQSQAWKIQTLAEITATPDDQLTAYDVRTFHEYMADVEEEVNRIELVKPIVQELCKKACEPPAVVEKKPAEPIEPSLPENPHGIDLEWN